MLVYENFIHRTAITVMERYERYERIQRLARLQAYGAETLADSGHTVEGIPDLVAKALANPTPEGIAQADLIVAEISRRSKPITRGSNGADSDLRAAYDSWGPDD